MTIQKVFPCVLHGINTMIAAIIIYPSMKDVARKNTRLVSFFNNSHYWGGQLLEMSAKEGIKRGLVINTESRWYALVLMFQSIQQHKYVISLSARALLTILKGNHCRHCVSSLMHRRARMDYLQYQRTSFSW